MEDKPHHDPDAEGDDPNTPCNEARGDTDEDIWANYQLRSCCFWMLVMLMPVVVIAASYVPAAFVMPMFCAYLVLVCVVGRQWTHFICPRCGKPFFRGKTFTMFGHRMSYHNLFSDKCVHCGLPKWAELEQSPPNQSDGVNPSDTTNTENKA